MTTENLECVQSGESTRWYLDEELHREDGPAREWADGGQEWWINGKRHRVRGAAVKRANGTKQWRRDGKLHRLGGLAIVRTRDPHVDRRKWFLHGEELSEEEHARATTSLRRRGRSRDGGSRSLRSGEQS